MYLKSTGSGELRAGNFETDSETEIMNPDQVNYDFRFKC